jgi:HAE1 family hydrophobic/amphiphilic exporter-1
VELTNWADQVLKKRLENVRGVGAVNLVGGTKREINIYLNPPPGGAGRHARPGDERRARREPGPAAGHPAHRHPGAVVQIDARIERPRTSAASSSRARRRARAPGQVARARWRAGARLEALYNGQRTLLLSVQKAQDENTIEVVDGLEQAPALQAELPEGVRLEPIQDNSRPIRVAVTNVRQTLIEGALLTVLIVFLFLNSWRSTVITGLTLPISLIGTFFFMQLFGFTINMITLMALSCAWAC